VQARIEYLGHSFQMTGSKHWAFFREKTNQLRKDIQSILPISSTLLIAMRKLSFLNQQYNNPVT